MKLAPDYLSDYLDTERTVYLILLLVCLGLGYYLYSLNLRRQQLETKTERFANRVPTYQKLRKKLVSGRPAIPDELKNNPLSFMERVIPQEFITNLQPINQEEGSGYQFQLRLESKRIGKILKLVSTLEREPLLSITEFSLIRESLQSNKFHSVMKLRTVQ